MTKKVLVAEPFSPAGLKLLQETCEVTAYDKLSPEELLRCIGAYDALIVRSATKVTAEVLAAGKNLQVVGRAGAGVDNIDLDAATRRGILVVNAPDSNTVAVAEHTIGLMLCLARHLCRADATMHQGLWLKKELAGTELRDKVLGLVGLGRVGSAVAARARAMEMRLLAYDPFVSPERAAQLQVALVPLEELLTRADYVSLHAPSNERTRGMIGARELALMKPGAYLINCARGDLVVEEALIEALTTGRLAGAALDVFPHEPQVNPALRACPNLVLTPHLGASTIEAQDEAAIQVAQQVLDVFQGRPPRYPVNVMPLAGEDAALIRPYLDLAQRLGRFYAQFAQNNITRVELSYAGALAHHDTSLITSAALAGLLAGVSETPVNLVNARVIARDRGLAVSEVRTSEAQDFAELVTLRVQTTTGERLLAGAILRGQPHIVRIDAYWFDFEARGLLLVSEHLEQPGVIGQMGTVLGQEGISISFVQVGRQQRGGYGLMVMGLDDPLFPQALERVRALPSVRAVYTVQL